MQNDWRARDVFQRRASGAARARGAAHLQQVPLHRQELLILVPIELRAWQTA